MASKEERINKLVQKRKIPLTRLKEIYEYGVNQTADQFYKHNFLARTDFAQEIYEEFQTAHNEIISLVDTDAEFTTQDKVRAAADKYMYTIKAKKYEVSLDTAGVPTGTDIDSNRHSVSGAKLPKINVPTFDGNIKLWPAFFDLYKSLIHENTSLANVQKFHYLMTSLKNDPYKLIKAIPMTGDNYRIAYDALVNRYQNKRFLATTYFNEIYTAQPLQRSSYKELRHLLDIFSENLAALKVLKFDTDSWDFLVFNMLLQKLDHKTRTDFEIENSTTEMPTYKILTTFLNNKCKALESVQCMMPNLPVNKNKRSSFSENSGNRTFSYNKQRTMPSAFLNAVDNQQPSTSHNRPKNYNSNCILCPSAHALHRCQLFLAKTPQDRLAFRASVHLLQHAEFANICITLLHLNINKRESAPQAPTSFETNTASITPLVNPGPNPRSKSDNDPASSLHCTTSPAFMKQSTVLLSTAEVEIRDGWGRFQKVRVLFDTASMANFISERCVNRLGLRRRHSSIPIEGINNLISTSNNGSTQCLIKPCGKTDPTFTFEAIVLPRICSDQPRVLINSQNWSHIENLPLADTKFHTLGPVDILLGAELVPFMLGSGRIFGKIGEPAAIETVFGWILQGRTECSSRTTALLSCATIIEPQIDLVLQKFWEIEQLLAPSAILSQDDIKCETLYRDSVSRDSSGRFVVPLPFRHSEHDFGDSYHQALRQFLSLETRLYKNPDLHVAYSDFFKEYLQKNYISERPCSEYRRSSAFYLPHHCVLRPDSVSTKIRVVFNAGAMGTKGLSLNDTLFSGPKLQHDLSTILLQFRTFPIVFICDIKQMYCQILIKPENRKYQRFLWRFTTTEEVKEYELNTVTFGVSSAPYLALRTLKELAIVEQENHPFASKVLQNSVYMDDCVAGAESVEAALHLQSKLITLLKKGCFELRKWASNQSAIFSAVPSDYSQMPLNFDTEGPGFIKVLGLQWNPNLDVFSYSVTPMESECTKRSMLSQIARICDPLGFLAPVIFLAKQLLQELWRSKTNWDDPPSDIIVQEWNRFKLELPEVAQIQLPRLIVPKLIARLEIHGFCDASTKGYGGVIYFRVVTFSGQIRTFLITGKSRVAPLKTISLPRLELCAVYLLADLITLVKESYSQQLTFDAVYAWSDSQVTLAWLSASPHRWKTFIANRVAHIQEIVPPVSWRYVPTKDNPADCVSRGLSPRQLLEHQLWWRGPDVLFNQPTVWPEQPSILLEKFTEASQEEKPLVLHAVVEASSGIISDLLAKFSSLRKIKRILAYVLRLCPRLRRQKKPESPAPADSENFRALQIIIKHVQADCFSDIFDACNKNSSLPKSFRKLAPFVDEAGILRVGGRLRHSSLPFDAKHPVLLPKRHKLTVLVIEQVHKENIHPGLKSLHNLILQNFWKISPRSAIYSCLSKCIRCFRCRPQACSPIMADLPEFRINQVKAFSQVALDYTGPFTITMGKHRAAKTSKAYICLFVCCATKALHLELTSDLTSDAFLASFRRFIARRGRVSSIYSDQATNFKSAYNQLQAFGEAASVKLAIQWHFNPPGAPHFNGLSEAGVKSVKTHLYRVVGQQLMTYEEFYTLLTQIESLLNSRPLS